MVISSCAKLFTDFLLSKKESDLMLLIRALSRQTSELFDPNFRKRKSSLMQVIRLAEELA